MKHSKRYTNGGVGVYCGEERISWLLPLSIHTNFSVDSCPVCGMFVQTYDFEITAFLQTHHEILADQTGGARHDDTFRLCHALNSRDACGGTT